MLKTYHLIILTLLISFASVTGLLFTPALPSMGKDLGISPMMSQWTITIFLIGYAIGQLPYGPLANRLGRKPAVFIGVAIACIGSIVAYQASSFGLLSLGRVLQALGSAAGLKVSFTMIADQHDGPRATRSIALLSLAFGIAPGLAVAIGGFITVYYSWKGCFLFLTFYSILIGVLACFLPETSKRLDKEALKLFKILNGYARQFKNPRLIVHALLVTLATSIFYIFAEIAPYIAIERIGLGPSEYGLWNLIPAAGTVTGGFFARLIADRFDHRTNILIGLGIALASSLGMGAFFLLGIFAALGFFITQFVIQGGINLIWSNANSEALASASDKSNASAVIQFINVGGACLSSFVVSFFSATQILLLPAIYLVIFGLMALLLKKGKAVS